MSRYVMLPKALIDHPLYKNMSDRSKILYGILLSRKKEARSRGWIDGNGCCYVIFPKQRMQEALGCGRYSLDMATRELATVDLIKMEYDRTPKIIRRIYVRGFNEHCGWVRMTYEKGVFIKPSVSMGKNMYQSTEEPVKKDRDQLIDDRIWMESVLRCCIKELITEIRKETAAIEGGSRK